MFFCFLLYYCSSLSVAMVAMVNQTFAAGNRSNDNNGTGFNNESEVCPYPVINNQSKQEADGEFEWDKKTQSNLLGAFFYGYLVMQVPGTA